MGESERIEVTSNNKDKMLEFLDRLREKVAKDEVFQMMIFWEECTGFAAQWTSSEDKYAMTGYAMAACMHRMKFD